jgi:hypothetical protein
MPGKRKLYEREARTGADCTGLNAILHHKLAG